MKNFELNNKIINLLKEYNNKFGIISEASKKDILINKLGASEENAKILDDIFGPLSVWIAKKIGDQYIKIYPKEYSTLKDVLRSLHFKAASWRNQFTSIKDYIVVGLNGNKSSLDNLNYIEIYSESKLWHDSLNVGNGKVNYIEKNPIIIDFRDENGEGYYWVDLQTKNSEEECERMGHCGRSSLGTLYSLRSYKSLPGSEFKINRSHLTAAIGENDGILYQLKGPKNSKPKEEYHKYILPLFDYVLDDINGYLIQGFGSEYNTASDFKLSDLPLETLKILYEKHPNLFTSRKLKEKMAELGIEIETEPLPTYFDAEFVVSYISNLINGDILISEKKTLNGQIKNTYLSEAIIIVNKRDYVIDWFEGQIEMPSWDEILFNYVNNELIALINKFLIETYPDQLEDDGIYNKEELISIIEEFDTNDDIKNSLFDAYSDVFSLSVDSIIDELLYSLQETLEFYGSVQFDDGYVNIYGDLSELVDINDPSIIDVYNEIEELDGEISVNYVFEALVSNNLITKPTWEMPDFDNIEIDIEEFNNTLENYLK